MKHIFNNGYKMNKTENEKEFYDTVYKYLKNSNITTKENFKFNYENMLKTIRNNLIDIKGYIDANQDKPIVVCGFEKDGCYNYKFKVELSDEYDKTTDVLNYFVDIVSYVNNSLMYIFREKVRMYSNYKNFEVGWTISAF